TSVGMGARRTDLFVAAEVSVNGDTTVELNARRAQEHRVRTPDPTDELAKATEVVRRTPGAVVSMATFTRADPDTVVYLTPVPAAKLGTLDTYDKRTLADSGLRMSATARPSATPAAGGPLHPRCDPVNTPAAIRGNRPVAV